MLRLEKTRIALRRVSSNPRFQDGRHSTGEVYVGASGKVISERNFVRGQDDPRHINYLSTMGVALRTPQVTISKEKTPLPMRIIVDRSLGQDHPDIVEGKRVLTDSLRESLIASKASRKDKVITHLIGDPKDPEIQQDLNFTSEIIDINHGTEYVADRVRYLSRRGFTFIISNFEGLEFNLPDGSFNRRTFALKTNTLAELEIPIGGIVTIGSGDDQEDIDTEDSEQLDPVNEQIRLNHQSIRDRLTSLGMALVDITIDMKLADGFDVEVTDSVIANNIYNVSGYKLN
jgi:hypothetical protein